MCVYSMVGDWARDTLPDKHPWIQPYTVPAVPMPNQFPITLPPEVTKAEFDALKRDVEDIKKLLQAAKKYDEETDQRECETEEKVALLRKIAELVGVDLDSI